MYRVSNIVEHLPKADHVFGAWVRIIYGSQLDRKKQSNDKTGETQYKKMETQQK